MKVAVTSQGGTLESPVDPRFGRAKNFVVVDTETGEFQAVSNTQNLNALQGAGIQAGQKVRDLGAAALITGHVGPKAFTTLTAAKIDIYINASGTVADAVDAFKAGTLPRADRADVDGHW